MKDQTKISISSLNYNIRALLWPRIRLWFMEGLNNILNFFSLRTSKRYWGIVYDSVSKQPLDPVIVKLLYADSREVETGVTDLSGRYGFLARPGKFKIFARKSNYSFPSRLVAGDTDGIYNNLYHGEFFVLSSDNEVVAPNIPMDPDRPDWNQQAKLRMSDANPYWKLFFKKITAAAFWFGFVYCGVAFWQHYPKLQLWLTSLLVAFVLLMILNLTVPEPRLWGRIKLKEPFAKGQRLFLELRTLTYRDVVSGKAAVLDNGKFLLRSSPGKYLLVAMLVSGPRERWEVGSLNVNIGSSGVLNSTLSFKTKRT
ncbi:MAG: hypothetical protein P4L74_00805 [Candidatus Doudnabacteria bacterium]|nr:hypothetical protein [Candidatus Doudnabacteria bacterium]